MFRYVIFVLFLCPLASADELYNSGWRINVDNDLLTGQSTDRDYTGGIAVTLSGRRVQQYPVTLESLRSNIDHLIAFPKLYDASSSLSFHSQQYGMTLFTPDDIDSVVPVYDDRPYASLFYMSNTEFTVLSDQDTAYVSRLTIGLLGLDAAEDVQSFLHDVTNSDVPSGWDHQVSSGGEPTFMLSYSMQKNLISTKKHQLKAEYEANIGFITDVNAGVSWRWGRINSSWWSFNPYQSKYIQQSMPVFSSVADSKDNELYLWAGGRLNFRVYNALLQGQFRSSEVTVSADELERLVAEIWFGVTAEIAKQYYASMFVRGHTAEFEGVNTRDAAWVGLVFTRTY